MNEQGQLERFVLEFKDSIIMIGVRTHETFGLVVYEEIKYNNGKKDISRFRPADDVYEIYRRMKENYIKMFNKEQQAG